jgi:hypothetical protein
MNLRMVPFLIAFLYATVCALSCYAQEFDPEQKDSENLSRKVVRVPLNQNVPADVKVGLQGITTLEFPGKIEAINGYGFAVQPNAETDEFQLTYEKGTNFLSLKALRPWVRANLTVVLNEKVYCFYCEESSDPSFVVILGAPGENARFASTGEPRQAVVDKKLVSREQLVGFLDKVKSYSALKSGSPDSIAYLRVVEPNKSGAVGQIETVIKRVVRDESLDLVGFEVQLGNKGQSDFYFDPEGFSVRVDDARYEACIADAGGIVPAGTSVPAFFVVQENTREGGRDLSVDQNFDVQIRALDTATNGNLTANFTLPPTDHIPTAGNSLKDPAFEPRRSVKEGEDKVGSAGKGDLAKEETQPKKKKIKEGSAQVSAKDHANKTPEALPKKHWFDLFRRSAITAQ